MYMHACKDNEWSVVAKISFLSTVNRFYLLCKFWHVRI